MKQKYYGLTKDNQIIFLGWFETMPTHLVNRYDVNNNLPFLDKVLNDDDLYRFINQAKDCLNHE